VEYLTVYLRKEFQVEVVPEDPVEGEEKEK